jgi:hypothetical protein
MVNLVAWVSCVSTLHGHLHLNGSSLLETEGQRNMFTFLKRTVKTDQRDVVLCGLQYYGFAWDNVRSFHASLRHHTSFHDVGVQRGTLGYRSGDRYQTIGRTPMVADDEVARMRASMTLSPPFRLPASRSGADHLLQSGNRRSEEVSSTRRDDPVALDFDSGLGCLVVFHTAQRTSAFTALARISVLPHDEIMTARILFRGLPFVHPIFGQKLELVKDRCLVAHK